ncbi:MAG: nucleotidyltransferase domain-containing protein, partial [Planctomycetes bacterium]|nr:nucleotidyltransferase domain-containing protein [Planctomycetota bacterium]
MDARLIDEVIRRIAGVVRPRRIVLFGSAATGTMTADSDIDLLVLKNDVRNPRQESTRLRAALGGLG